MIFQTLTSKCPQLKHILRRNKNYFSNHKKLLSTTNLLKHCEDENFENNTPKKLLTMSEVELEIHKRLGHGCAFLEKPKDRSSLLKYQQEKIDLPPRSMQDSFTEAIIPLGTDVRLQNKYVKLDGTVRKGRLMEDLDLFAVWICHKHIYLPKLDPSISFPYTIVTAMVDKIEFSDYDPVYNLDIRFSGHVCWVGNTSLEVVVWVEQKNLENKNVKITRALIVLVARNAINSSSAPVNQIEPANEAEKKIYSGAQDRKNRRLTLQNSSLSKVSPTPSEYDLIHKIFLQTIPKSIMTINKNILPRKCKWIQDSTISNISYTFPENRNAHNKIFGGHIMRIAAEISQMCALLYGGIKKPLKLDKICDISFNKSIDMSVVLKLTSTVIYTVSNYVQIVTILEIPNEKEWIVTNMLYYTFKSDTIVPEVVPRSYLDAIWYLEGKRKFLYAMNKDNT